MIHVEMLRWRGDDDRIVNAMATAGGPLGDTLHAPVYADLGPQVLVVLFKMSALSVRGDAPLARSRSSDMVQEAASWFSICLLPFCLDVGTLMV